MTANPWEIAPDDWVEGPNGFRKKTAADRTRPPSVDQRVEVTLDEVRARFVGGHRLTKAEVYAAFGAIAPSPRWRSIMRALQQLPLQHVDTLVLVEGKS